MSERRAHSLCWRVLGCGPTLAHRHGGLVAAWPAQGGSAPEGVAVFYRRSRFRARDHHGVLLRDCFAEGGRAAPLLRPARAAAGKGCEAVTKLSTVVQLCALEERQSRRLLAVANMHLFYHKDAAHIRSLQAAATS